MGSAAAPASHAGAPTPSLTTPGKVCDSSPVTSLVSLRAGDDDTLWAVIATAGRRSRVANVYRSRSDALEDRAWRAQQVSAYEDFLRRSRQPVPHYSVAPIRRADLPKKWSPLPALGFLRGQFI
jgi:hypothetical protein